MSLADKPFCTISSRARETSRANPTHHPAVVVYGTRSIVHRVIPSIMSLYCTRRVHTRVSPGGFSRACGDTTTTTTAVRAYTSSPRLTIRTRPAPPPKRRANTTRGNGEKAKRPRGRNTGRPRRHVANGRFRREHLTSANNIPSLPITN